MEIFLSFIFYSPHSFSTLDGKRKTRRTSADIVKLNRERRCLAGCKRDSRHKEKYKEDYERLYLQPFVDTFSMELVRAGQDPDDLPGLEVRHADHADSLVTLAGVSLLGGIPAGVRS